MQQTFGHPSAGPGCLVESKRQETHSKRLVARLEGQSAWARIYPIEIYGEARNRIHARNGEMEETTEVLSSPLLSKKISWHYFTFYTRRLCVVW